MKNQEIVRAKSQIENIEVNHGNQGIPVNELRKLEKMIVKQGDIDKNSLMMLLDSMSLSAQELGLMLLHRVIDMPQQRKYEIILKYSDHDSWEVREYAADALSNFLSENFLDYEDRLYELRNSDRENVRRAVVLSLKYLGKKRDRVLNLKILPILRHYMDDPSDYVRKNLGPFAFGDGFIEYEEELVLNIVNEDFTSSNLWVRWNIAMVFSTASGAKRAMHGMSILNELIMDSEKQVRTAAMSALRNIYRRNIEWRKRVKEIAYGAMLKHEFPKPSTNFLNEL